MTVEKLRYRLLAPTDDPVLLDKVAGMHLDSWKDAYAGLIPEYVLQNWFTKKGFVEEYGRLMLNEGVSILVGELCGEPIGIAIFGIVDGRHRIEALYIALGHRREGRGAELLSEVLKRMGDKVVALDCAEGNHAGRAFWETQRFVYSGAHSAPFEVADGVAPVPTVEYVLDCTK